MLFRSAAGRSILVGPFFLVGPLLFQQRLPGTACGERHVPRRRLQAWLYSHACLQGSPSLLNRCFSPHICWCMYCRAHRMMSRRCSDWPCHQPNLVLRCCCGCWECGVVVSACTACHPLLVRTTQPRAPLIQTRGMQYVCCCTCLSCYVCHTCLIAAAQPALARCRCACKVVRSRELQEAGVLGDCLQTHGDGWWQAPCQWAHQARPSVH